MTYPRSLCPDCGSLVSARKSKPSPNGWITLRDHRRSDGQLCSGSGRGIKVNANPDKRMKGGSGEDARGRWSELTRARI